MTILWSFYNEADLWSRGTAENLIFTFQERNREVKQSVGEEVKSGAGLPLSSPDPQTPKAFLDYNSESNSLEHEDLNLMSQLL